MKLADLTPNGLLVLAGLAAAGAVTFYVIKKGGLGAAASAGGAAAVGAVGDITTGAVGQLGAAVGLPRPSQTTTDAAVVRWIIDHPLGGYMAASEWAGAPALARALLMASGSGRPPPAGTDLAVRFPELPQASYDETDRLANRYPGAPASTLFTETLNPASSENIVNRGVTGAGAAISGDRNWTLGGWVYDVTH